MQDLDKEVVNLCVALNSISGVKTICSCSGHGDKPLQIWMEVEDIKTINLISWAGCHRWWHWKDGWRLMLDMGDPDRDGSDIGLLLESKELGEPAYEKAESLAAGITKFIKEWK